MRTLFISLFLASIDSISAAGGQGASTSHGQGRNSVRRIHQATPVHGFIERMKMANVHFMDSWDNARSTLAMAYTTEVSYVALSNSDLPLAVIGIMSSNGQLPRIEQGHWAVFIGGTSTGSALVTLDTWVNELEKALKEGTGFPVALLKTGEWYPVVMIAGSNGIEIEEATIQPEDDYIPLAAITIDRRFELGSMSAKDRIDRAQKQLLQATAKVEMYKGNMKK